MNNQKSGVTPLMKQAVKVHNTLYAPLYPGLHNLFLDENNFIRVTEANISWKLVPWFFSIVVFTCVFGCGCIFVTVCDHLIFRTQLDKCISWNLFSTIMVIFFLLFGVAGLLCRAALHHWPQIFASIEAVQMLEAKCKQNRM